MISRLQGDGEDSGVCSDRMAITESAVMQRLQDSGLNN